jgi:hypothetical protein
MSRDEDLDALVDIEGIFKHSTAAAILMDTGGKTGPVWIPKSQIQDADEDPEDCEAGEQITVRIPEWLAIEKGLV